MSKFKVWWSSKDKMTTTINILRFITLFVLVISIATINCQWSRSSGAANTGRYVQKSGQWNPGRRSTKSGSDDGELKLLHVVSISLFLIHSRKKCEAWKVCHI